MIDVVTQLLLLISEVFDIMSDYKINDKDRAGTKLP